MPAVSHKIYTHNKLDQGPKINLRGLAIGNGLTDPAIQYGAYADFALENGLVSQSTRDNIKRFLPVCTFGINACNNWPILGPFVCPLALQFCQTTQFASILAAAGNVNVYAPLLIHPVWSGAWRSCGVFVHDCLCRAEWCAIAHCRRGTCRHCQ